MVVPPSSASVLVVVVVVVVGARAKEEEAELATRMCTALAAARSSLLWISMWAFLLEAWTNRRSHLSS